MKTKEKNSTSFIAEMKTGMRVKTPDGNGTIKSIIEDIHCSVNVTMDNGKDKNFMLYDYTENGDLIINLYYENSK